MSRGPWATDGGQPGGVQAPPPAGWGAGAPDGGAPPPYDYPGAPRAPRLSGGAIAAMVIGGLLLFVVGGVVGAAMTFFVFFEGAPDPITEGTGGTVPGFELAVGDCAVGVLADGGGWATGNAVGCETPHDFEVYASAEVPAEAGEDYPEALAWYGDGFCHLAFDSFVGRDYWDSDLDYEVVLPSEQAWADGRRSLHCVLGDMFDEPLVGSALGSGW